MTPPRHTSIAKPHWAHPDAFTPPNVTAIVAYSDPRSGRDAIALADALTRHGPRQIVIAHVAPDGDAGWARSELRLEKLARRLLGDWTQLDARTIDDRSPTRGLLRLATSEHADLVVTGPPSGTRARTTSERLLADTPCPVALAPAGWVTGPRRIDTVAVAYDGRHESEAALREGVALAPRLGARLRLVGVAPVGTLAHFGLNDDSLPAIMPPRERMASALWKAAAGFAAVPVETELQEGDAVTQLLDSAERADLLVCGAHGHSLLGRRVKSSIVHELVGRTPIPLLIVPHRN
jgi:nucleotide-binding universal stress UspA family protein